MPQPTDTGWSQSFSTLNNQSAKLPVWWAFMHALSRAVTGASVAAIPCGTDLRQMRMEIDATRIDDPVLAVWYLARVTPHPFATFTQPVPAGTARSEAIPRAYISCTAGPLTSLFGRFAEKARRSGWEVRTIATGHEAELIAPDEVARLLLELAGSRG